MTRPVEDARVTVVVMSRNRRRELLASLSRHRAPVVYVDNASTDGSAEAVRAAHPDGDVIELDRNAGAYARTGPAGRGRRSSPSPTTTRGGRPARWPWPLTP